MLKLKEKNLLAQGLNDIPSYKHKIKITQSLNLISN